MIFSAIKFAVAAAAPVRGGIKRLKFKIQCFLDFLGVVVKVCACKPSGFACNNGLCSTKPGTEALERSQGLEKGFPDFYRGPLLVKIPGQRVEKILEANRTGI